MPVPDTRTNSGKPTILCTELSSLMTHKDSFFQSFCVLVHVSNMTNHLIDLYLIHILCTMSWCPVGICLGVFCWLSSWNYFFFCKERLKKNNQHITSVCSFPSIKTKWCWNLIWTGIYPMVNPLSKVFIAHRMSAGCIASFL